MNRNPTFLSLHDVLIIHKNQIELYGGQDGLRSMDLLSSAIAVPESTFDGEYLHKNIYEMAAAYAYHIGMNHPFIDGNKRAALASALIFLDLNGIELDDSGMVLYDAMIRVASGIEKKDYLANIFKRLASK